MLYKVQFPDKCLAEQGSGFLLCLYFYFQGSHVWSGNTAQKALPPASQARLIQPVPQLWAR